ncbi:DNA-binding protein [Bradyrhizobium sp. 170]|nr:DNA-binding protein [Bradyrhizobium sp. 170]
MAAAQALIVEGGEINPMRVRMRLGGGNVSRIKAVVAKMPRQEPLSASPSGLPQTLVRELQQMSSEASQQFLSVITRYWTSTHAESAGPAREENAALRTQIDGLEREALASSERLARAERQRDEMARAVKQLGKERDELAQNFGGLQSALRNAESDFRAAQRLIDSFERNRREDRDQIRDLQKRIEDLVGEIALLRVKASGQLQKVRPRSASTSKSRVGRAT